MNGIEWAKDRMIDIKVWEGMREKGMKRNGRK